MSDTTVDLAFTAMETLPAAKRKNVLRGKIVVIVYVTLLPVITIAWVWLLGWCAFKLFS